MVERKKHNILLWVFLGSFSGTLVLGVIIVALQATDEDYFTRIYLRTEDNADFQALMKVMGNVNAAGFSNVGLVTNPAIRGSAP